VTKGHEHDDEEAVVRMGREGHCGFTLVRVVGEPIPGPEGPERVTARVRWG
jgi:hypothetical protein